MRHAEGERGVLAKDVRVLCCGDVIPAGVEVKIGRFYSPKRVFLYELPERPFLQCGHAFAPLDGDLERFDRDMKTMPQSGPLEDLAKLPKAVPVHKVKASAIWFQGEQP